MEEERKCDISRYRHEHLNNKTEWPSAPLLMGISGPGHGTKEAMAIWNGLVTRRHSVHAHYGLDLDVLCCVRGKIDCFDSRDSTEGLGGVGRVRDELG